MVVLLLKQIKPKKLKRPEVRKKVEKTLRNQGKILKKDYQGTVRFWHNKPKFEAITDISESDASVLVGPTGDDEATRIYMYVHDGTSTRYALTSPTWRSKTTPGSLTSNRGRGKIILRGRKAFQKRRMRPRPGIVARNFSDLIEKKRRKEFQKALEEAIKSPVADTFN